MTERLRTRFVVIGTGVLTLSGSSSVANYQAALQSSATIMRISLLDYIK